MDRVSESEMVDVPIRTTSARDYGMGPPRRTFYLKALKDVQFIIVAGVDRHPGGDVRITRYTTTRRARGDDP